MIVALTRPVSSSIATCELTHLDREPIDLARARAQHEAYERALASVGCRVISLPELPDNPDAVFVEDAAIVLDEVAVLTRPGAPSRRGEVDAIADSLAAFRHAERINEPGTLDGGDVLRLGRTLYVGLTSRTSAAGVEQLRAIVSTLGYAVETVDVAGALHLKTAVTQVGPNWILANPEWVDVAQFPGYDALVVDPAEPFAANAVYVNGAVVHSTAFPRTQDTLRAHGVRVIGVDASELAKAEGGVTCCSLLFDVIN
ncbi:MAG: arginine deiminase-related protein [Gemmatimonadaceae bacterium]